MSVSGDRPLTQHAAAWFAAEQSSVSAARRYTAAQLSRWGLRSRSCIASLVVSELTTNAVRHARSGFELDLSHADGTLRIAVRDESRMAPVLRELDVESDAGRGLRIVAELASEWGFELRVDGKLVWARVSDSASQRRSRRPNTVKGGSRACRRHATRPDDPDSR